MPITQLIIQDLLLLCLESLAETSPTTAHSASAVADATLFDEPLSHLLIGVTHLLELDNAAIIGIVIGADRFRTRSVATLHTKTRDD